jgi:predicted amidophosphoribosyltransferase
MMKACPACSATYDDAKKSCRICVVLLVPYHAFTPEVAQNGRPWRHASIAVRATVAVDEILAAVNNALNGCE